MSDAMAGEKFGQRSPPLSDLIKGILKRYPDGQIFKEILQNADDAGAKKVQFYVDHREHGTASLPHPDLAKLQGPALISANDACFTEEDWEGIQKLQQSIKAEDPFKVGRFGIGFNSVYHITDVPIILSGEKMAYFEPQEQIWPGQPGQAFKLSYLSENAADVLKPFCGIDEFNLETSKHRNTLFRFPLRRVGSYLSENIYTPKDVIHLINALKEEAKLLLLFLRSVNSIEVHNISTDGRRSLHFSVCIADSDKLRVDKERNEFMLKLDHAHKYSAYNITEVISYASKFEVQVTGSTGELVSKHDWLVVNQVGSKLHEVLDAAKDQHTFPWVGAAVELNKLTDGGRIFCFLPMPIEAVTGLPVHVNGTFGVADDRRSLIWPGAERKNDLTANWNHLVVKELLPSCYLSLVMEARFHLANPDELYHIWSDLLSVQSTQWNIFLKPFFQKLLTEPVFYYIEHSETYWVTLKQSSFLPNENTPVPTVVQQILMACGLKLVSVPSTVWDIFKHYLHPPDLLTKVSPKLTRNKLRSNPIYHKFCADDKRNMLMYCLNDREYNDLCDICLIPLANGEYTCLKTRKETSNIYLCTSDYPKYLLPNLDQMLVNISDDHDLQMSFEEIARKANTNLKLLTEGNVASLLKKSMPLEWKNCKEVVLTHPNFPLAWFRLFWLWVKERKLKNFEGRFIVPISCSNSQSSTEFKFVQLSSKTPILYVPAHKTLSNSLKDALLKLGVKFTLKSDFPYLNHKDILSYLKEFDAKNTLDAVFDASRYTMVTFSMEEANELKTHLGAASQPRSASFKLSEQQLTVLRNLPIFETEANTKRALCSVNQAASESILGEVLLIQEKSVLNSVVSKLPKDVFLFSTTPNQTKLLHCMEISCVSDIELLNKLFNLIKDESFCEENIDSFMVEILNLYHVFSSKYPLFVKRIQKIPFLCTGSSKRSCPIDTFDPNNPTLKLLFKGKNVFPLHPFTTTEYLGILRQCGLRTKPTPQEILDIIAEIGLEHTMHDVIGTPAKVDHAKFSQSIAVIKHICSPDFEQNFSSHGAESQNLLDALSKLVKNKLWMPVFADAPERYPSSLKWRGKNYSNHFVSLNSDVLVVSRCDLQELSYIVGSQMFFVCLDSQKVVSILTNNSEHKKVMIQHVLTHFKEIIKCKDQIPHDLFNTMIISIYSYLYRELGDNDLPGCLRIQNWIYIKKHNKFVSSDVVAVNPNGTFLHELDPYVYVLPESLHVFSRLFERCGVEISMTQSQILSTLEKIKARKDSSYEPDESIRAWDIVMSVLNWITDNGTKPVSISSDDILYVPTESESNSTWPQLLESSKVVYTDNKFLKEFLLTCVWQYISVKIHDYLAAHAAF